MAFVPFAGGTVSVSALRPFLGLPRFARRAVGKIIRVIANICGADGKLSAGIVTGLSDEYIGKEVGRVRKQMVTIITDSSVKIIRQRIQERAATTPPNSTNNLIINCEPSVG